MTSTISMGIRWRRNGNPPQLGARQPGKRRRARLYIDNYNHNYIFHHNMVWNVRGANIHVNLPSQNVYVVNNTCTGGSGGMGRWKIDWMYNVPTPTMPSAKTSETTRT